MAFDRHHRSRVLTFLLPKGARADLARGTPDVFGCLFEIGRYLGLVSIYGRSKEAVFAQAGQILARACDGRHIISANLYTSYDNASGSEETRDWLFVGGAIDSWTIVLINGETAFAPTALGAEFPIDEAARAPPPAKAANS